MQVRSSGRIPPCDPGSAKGGQHRIGHHRSEWIRAGKGRGSVCGARAHHPRRLVRLTERLFGCIMGTRSPETAPVRDLRGGSRRAARTHRRSRLGSQHDPQARTHTGRAAVGLNRQGAHQKEHSHHVVPYRHIVHRRTWLLHAAHAPPNVGRIGRLPPVLRHQRLHELPHHRCGRSLGPLPHLRVRTPRRLIGRPPRGRPSTLAGNPPGWLSRRVGDPEHHPRSDNGPRDAGEPIPCIVDSHDWPA